MLTAPSPPDPLGSDNNIFFGVDGFRRSESSGVGPDYPDSVLCQFESAILPPIGPPIRRESLRP